MLWNVSSDISIGEAYIYDDFDIERYIEVIYPVAEYPANLDMSLIKRLHLGWDLLRFPSDPK